MSRICNFILFGIEKFGDSLIIYKLNNLKSYSIGKIRLPLQLSRYQNLKIIEIILPDSIKDLLKWLFQKNTPVRPLTSYRLKKTSLCCVQKRNNTTRMKRGCHKLSISIYKFLFFCFFLEFQRKWKRYRLHFPLNCSAHLTVKVDVLPESQNVFFMA